jgi:diacylglycerol kinase family enzyme
MLLGSWRNDAAIEIENVRSVTVRTKRRKVRAMIDGEVGMIDGPFDFKIHPRGLKVLAGPVAAEAEETPTLKAAS